MSFPKKRENNNENTPIFSLKTDLAYYYYVICVLETNQQVLQLLQINFSKENSSRMSKLAP